MTTTDSLPEDAPGYHVPVMLAEVLEGLNIQPGGTYVDCTFGGGGHSKGILERLDNTGRLVAFDRDADAKQNAPGDDRFLFVPQDFKHLGRFLRLHKIDSVDGILADLGVSSHQFNTAERGFSTRYDAALDMRMDRRETLTAAVILNTYEEGKLKLLFEKYGEVTNSKTLAKLITELRLVQRFETIEGFKQGISGIVKGNPNKYFAQVFQALRIEVNKETEALEEMLKQCVPALKEGGRLAVLTFHSLEDRIVKNFFKTGRAADEAEEENVFGTKEKSPFRILTKKPLTASAAELKQNPRSRSAKLRVAEKH